MINYKETPHLNLFETHISETSSQEHSQSRKSRIGLPFFILSILFHKFNLTNSSSTSTLFLILNFIFIFAVLKKSSLFDKKINIK